MLPHPSTAFHVCVLVYPHVPFTDTSLNKFTVTLLHPSLAVGAVNDGVPVHSTVASAPWPPITGAVLSVTVIVCDTVLLILPHPSTAFHVCVLVYPQVPVTLTSLNKFTVTLLHPSDAVGAVNTGVPVHSTVALAPCPPITGAVLSVTVMVCDTVLLMLPHPSIAFHVCVLVYPHVPVTLTSLNKFTVTLLHPSL